MYINNKKVSLHRFSSGELKLQHKDLLPLIKDGEVEIFYNQEETFFELMLVLKYYKSRGVKVHLILGYLPYQRMDKENDVEPRTLSYVIDILNDLHLDSLTICEPHCNTDGINNVRSISLIDKLYPYVSQKLHLDANNHTLVFCDKGGVERYKNLPGNKVYFEKVRDKETGLIVSHKIVGEIPNDSIVIIVDDIISSGGTIRSTIETIGREVYIVVGHYEVNKYNTDLLYSPNIKKIYSSDSLTKIEQGNLKLYNIRELIER